MQGLFLIFECLDIRIVLHPGNHKHNTKQNKNQQNGGVEGCWLPLWSSKFDDEDQEAAEEPSSQTSGLDESELDKLVLDSKPENTKKCTWFQKSSWKNETSWLTSKPLKQTSSTTTTWKKFYAEVRSAKNEMLTHRARWQEFGVQ